jgi:hypothetical protein
MADERMVLPPTWRETLAASREFDGSEAARSRILTMLDADAYFAGCSVDDLDPEDVEVIVRWALREFVLRNLFHGRRPAVDDDPASMAFAAEARGDMPETKGRQSPRDRAHKSIWRVIDQLRELNEQAEAEDPDG